MKKVKQTKGITLIALVITIIVLLILAGITINLTLGQEGIIKKAEQAGKNYVNAANAEQEQLAGLTNELEEVFKEKLVTGIILNEPEVKIVVNEDKTLLSAIEPSNATNSKLIWSSSDESIAVVNELGVVTGVGRGNAIITATATDGSGVTASCSVEVMSYIGYYADVDNNGTVDGVIFADMLIGGSGEWANDSGTWEITKTSNTKNYVISQASYKGVFGTAPVLQASGDGNDRFYVMALNDLDSATHPWYYSARSGISDYEIVTSTKFGTGKNNTKKMIDKWNSTAYGAQNTCSGGYTDVWGVVKNKYPTCSWFVPSKEEWAAFGSAFDITSSNYSNYGLKSFYWTSSLVDTTVVHIAYYSIWSMYGAEVGHAGGRVRLCTIF